MYPSAGPAARCTGCAGALVEPDADADDDAPDVASYRHDHEEIYELGRSTVLSAQCMHTLMNAQIRILVSSRPGRHDPGANRCPVMGHSHTHAHTHGHGPRRMTASCVGVLAGVDLAAGPWSRAATLCCSSAAALCGSSAATLCCSNAAALCGSSAAALCGSSAATLCGSSAATLCGSSAAALCGSSAAPRSPSSAAALHHVPQ